MLDVNYAKKTLRELCQAYGAKGLDENTMSRLATAPMPDVYSSDFPREYVAYNLLRKWALLETGIDTKAAAKAAFEEAENICYYVNKNRGVIHTTNRHKKRIGERVIFHAIRKISRMFSDLDVADLIADCDHSGGASLQRPRRSSSVYNKWGDRNNLTRSAVGYWLCFKGANKLYASKMEQVFTDGPNVNTSVTFVSSGRGSFVPKDAKTDRPIGIEPQGNMLLQKGVGGAIRRRLLKVGIDLRDQLRNQTLCQDYNNATIDMKSASDRISLSTVVLLLQQTPVLLDAVLSLRTPNLTFDDRTYLLQKCSGMGNGFTFELESLLFYALAWSSRQVAIEDGILPIGTISVYGDDMIVPRNVAYHLTTTLNYLGMSVNRDKSYVSGPFRESCGMHVWNGADCTPMYIKDSRFDNPGDWYHLFNSLNELLDRVYSARAHNILKSLFKKLRKHNLVHYVPASYSIRSGIRASFSVAVPHLRRPRRRHGIDMVITKVFTPKVGSYRVNERGYFVAHVYRLRNRPSRAPGLLALRRDDGRVVALDIVDPPREYCRESDTRKETFLVRRVHPAAWDECHSCFWVI